MLVPSDVDQADQNSAMTLKRGYRDVERHWLVAGGGVMPEHVVDRYLTSLSEHPFHWRAQVGGPEREFGFTQMAPELGRADREGAPGCPVCQHDHAIGVE